MRGTLDVTTQTYNKIAHQYEATHFRSEFWKKEFKIFQGLINGKRIIDIGCGAGRDAVNFVKIQFDYLGIDASSEMIRRATKREPNGQYRVMDMYNLKLKKGAYDGFWASASLLHVTKRRIRKVLRSLRVLLDDQGIGFISLKKKKQMSEGMLREKKLGGIDRYWSFYSKREFKKILEESGFNVVRSHTMIENDTWKTNWLCYYVKKI